mgnify:CR=1 FL=1
MISRDNKWLLAQFASVIGFVVTAAFFAASVDAKASQALREAEDGKTSRAEIRSEMGAQLAEMRERLDKQTDTLTEISVHLSAIRVKLGGAP